MPLKARKRLLRNQFDMYANQKDWASLVEMLHISSLIHDDILDSAPTRRGLESTHYKYGVKNACFGADYMIGRGFYLRFIQVLRDNLVFKRLLLWRNLNCFRFMPRLWII